MNVLEKAWYSKAPWLFLLVPVAWCFRGLSALRRKWQTPAPAHKSRAVPVIVVGNISVGGTGKTPLLIALVKHFQANAMTVGVISRGYGGKAGQYPLEVTSASDPALAGDEPVLIATLCDCPVIVDPDRPRALAQLTASHELDVVLSDDGLQHYRLPRDMEIVVVDGARLFGNGRCLPAGPLREPVSRLRTVDAVVLNGEPEAIPALLEDAVVMHLRPVLLRNLASDEQRNFNGAPFKLGYTIQAVAAIGNPHRFFKLLEQLPYPLRRFPFPDHHPLTRADLERAGVDLSQPVVMTEKDGIKCRQFAANNWWAVQVEVDLPPDFLDALVKRVRDWPG
ncbi:MAG: tetraacyldisaccharide 4'-kinase [Pseudohongiellaceae bacterium]